jgi:hypothetical protein
MPALRSVVSKAGELRKEYSVAHRGLDLLEHEGVSPEGL